MNIIEHTPAVAKAPKAPRYFCFSQNNSGGSKTTYRKPNKEEA